MVLNITLNTFMVYHFLKHEHFVYIVIWRVRLCAIPIFFDIVSHFKNNFVKININFIVFINNMANNVIQLFRIKILYHHRSKFIYKYCIKSKF